MTSCTVGEDVWRQRTCTVTDGTSAAAESTNPLTAVSRLSLSFSLADKTEKSEKQSLQLAEKSAERPQRQ